MEREQQPAADDFEAEVERAIEDKREAVLAADVTGIVQSELTPVPELPPE